MFQKEITVLAVDDEPDVLSITKLALRGMSVGGNCVASKKLLNAVVSIQ